MMFDYIAQIWFFIGIILIVLEVVFGMTIVLFFASLSAFTLGFLIYLDKLDPANFVAQGILFLVFILIWAALLWKKLKNFYGFKRNNDEYQNIIGQSAVLLNDLHKGKTGSIRWSGTTVKAEIDPNSKHRLLAKDEEVTVIRVQNNIFIIDKR
jgi:membrane protein implicated in regulation of membrane protease activity